MDHEKISAIREALLNEEDAPRAWAELATLAPWLGLTIDDEGLLLRAEVAEVLVPPGPQLVWLKGLKAMAGRLGELTEVDLSPDLQPFFDADELLLFLRGDRPLCHFEIVLDVDGLGGRYGECLLTEPDCKALVRSIVQAKGSKGLADWIHDHLDVPIGSGEGPLSGSYDLKFHQPPPEWFGGNVFGCAGLGEPELGDLVDYEPSSFYVGLGEISRGHLGALRLVLRPAGRLRAGRGRRAAAGGRRLHADHVEGLLPRRLRAARVRLRVAAGLPLRRRCGRGGGRLRAGVGRAVWM